MKEFTRGRIHYIILILWIASCSVAAYNLVAGTIQLNVQDAYQRQVLAGTLVRIRTLHLLTITNENGVAYLQNIPPGRYQIECKHPEYPRFIYLFQYRSTRDTSVCVAIPPIDKSEDVFYIGGFEVAGKKANIPVDYTATTRFTAADLQMLQATNLGDVLEMIPGLRKSNRIGLDKAIYANVQGDMYDRFGVFGTKIIVDHAPISNNSNISIRDLNGSNNSGYGVDLRIIPADNIESVEVIRGIPPARYGDLTTGLIHVRTKIQSSRPRIKLKHNPTTREANYYQGFQLGQTRVATSLNYGFSERDIRKEGDEYHRLSASLSLKREMPTRNIVLQSKTFVTRLIDEEQPTDINEKEGYDRGYRFRENVWAEWQFGSQSKLELTAYLHYTRTNRYRSKWVSGAHPGYRGEIRMNSHEYTTGGTIVWHGVWIQARTVHDVDVGTEFQIDGIGGDGIVLDSTKNYYGFDSSLRSFPLQHIPSLKQIAFYVEDQWTTTYWMDATWIIGFRYEMLGPRVNRFQLRNWENRHGAFLCPRLGAVIHLSSHWQMRAGYGKAVKSPSLYYLYQSPQVHYFGNKHRRIQPMNRRLRAYAATEWKIGVDYQLSRALAASVDLYKSRRFDAFYRRTYPVWEPTGQVIGMPTYKRWENLSWQYAHGTELSIDTGEWHGLSVAMIYNYRWRRWGTDTPEYESHPVFSAIDSSGLVDLDPYWQDPGDQWHKTWSLDVRADWRLRQAGFWLQVMAQMVPAEKFWEEDLYSQGNWSNKVKSYPAMWILNIYLSKQIGHGTEVSFFINNVLNDQGVYSPPWGIDYNPLSGRIVSRSYMWRKNPLFWGIECSARF